MTHDLADPHEALGAYVDEMRAWVDAVREGESLEDVIPVHVPPTTEYADKLGARLDLIEREILRNHAFVARSP